MGVARHTGAPARYGSTLCERRNVTACESRSGNRFRSQYAPGRSNNLWRTDPLWTRFSGASGYRAELDDRQPRTHLYLPSAPGRSFCGWHASYRRRYSVFLNRTLSRRFATQSGAFILKNIVGATELTAGHDEDRQRHSDRRCHHPSDPIAGSRRLVSRQARHSGRLHCATPGNHSKSQMVGRGKPSAQARSW